MSTKIKLPEPGTENELEEYYRICPILDRESTPRVHMQVTIVTCFYLKPDITDKELSAVIMSRYPNSTWGTDPIGRAKADRRKYNNGSFRCMGSWSPDPDSKYYAKPRVEKPKEDSDESGS